MTRKSQVCMPRALTWAHCNICVPTCNSMHARADSNSLCSALLCAVPDDMIVHTHTTVQEKVHAAQGAQRPKNRPQSGLPCLKDKHAANMGKPQRPVRPPAPGVQNKGANHAPGLRNNDVSGLQVVGAKIGPIPRPISAGRVPSAGRNRQPVQQQQHTKLADIAAVPPGLPPIVVPKVAKHQQSQPEAAPVLPQLSQGVVQQCRHSSSPPGVAQHKGGPSPARSPLHVVGQQLDQGYPDDYWGDFFQCRTPAESPVR